MALVAADEFESGLCQVSCVSGKLGADACKPDVGDIVAEIGKKAVTKEVGKQIEKAIGGDAGKALKNLLNF